MRARGEFALVDQNMQAAIKTSGQPVKRGTMAHEHDVIMLLCEAAVQRRDAAVLRQYASQLEELALRDAHRLYLPIACRAWGVSHRLDGEHVEAFARLDQSLKLFGELETRWQIGRTLFELGELDLARSDQVGARAHFSQALEAFDALKAAPDAERARAALQGLADGRYASHHPRQ